MALCAEIPFPPKFRLIFVEFRGGRCFTVRHSVSNNSLDALHENQGASLVFDNKSQEGINGRHKITLFVSFDVKSAV